MRRRADARKRHETSSQPQGFELGLLLPGIKINTSPTDYFPVEQMQMSRFNGEHGELFGSAIGGEVGTQ
jgi:branched-chain amino acid transport system substrate-binding protein